MYAFLLVTALILTTLLINLKSKAFYKYFTFRTKKYRLQYYLLHLLRVP
jgi:hypothetical protein